ncbi:MAG: sigma-70 family RNA polymerase sigma factor [Planctomycetes bacterium]|nr:sigma-70 family RNA polymerase sigma factor [Planctomycetota bacterium]
MDAETSVSLLTRMRGFRDKSAWREFHCTYAVMLMGVCKRFGLCDADARDAIQNLLISVHAKFKSLNRPFDRSKRPFKAWLKTLTRNKVVDLIRDQRRRKNLAMAYARTLVELEEVFEEETRKNLLDRALLMASQEFEPTTYQAFELCAIEGRKPKEVAQFLGVTRNVVYISKHKVLKRVREIVDRLQEQEG